MIASHGHPNRHIATRFQLQVIKFMVLGRIIIAVTQMVVKPHGAILAMKMFNGIIVIFGILDFRASIVDDATGMGG
jgi:hypothetical protein